MRLFISHSSKDKSFVRQLVECLLVDAKIPQLGTDASMEVPRPLLHSSFDAGCRIAEALKVRRAELRTGTVLARLTRETDREIAAVQETLQT